MKSTSVTRDLQVQVQFARATALGSFKAKTMEDIAAVGTLGLLMSDSEMPL